MFFNGLHKHTLICYTFFGWGGRETELNPVKNHTCSIGGKKNSSYLYFLRTTKLKKDSPPKETSKGKGKGKGKGKIKGKQRERKGKGKGKRKGKGKGKEKLKGKYTTYWPKYDP